MGSSERKERQRATLQQQILDAAREITIRDGFAALTMRKIAQAIEYAPGTIYLYFESRDEIAIQLCRQGYQELLECLQPTATIADPRDRLRAIANACWESPRPYLRRVVALGFFTFQTCS